MEDQEKNGSAFDIFGRSSGKILVVDDEPLVRKSISKYLARKGYLVDSAEDGAVAIQMLGRNSYDLVLTDLVMPNIDGRELLKFMTGKYPDIPKIVFTGFGDDRDIILALQSGARDYIFKPIIDFSILDHSVRRVMELKKLNDDKKRYLEEVRQINEIISMLNRGMNTEEIFRTLSVMLKKIIPFSRLDLIIIEEKTERIIWKLNDTESGIMFDDGDREIMRRLIDRDYPDDKRAVIVDDLGEYLKNNPESKNAKVFIGIGLKSLLLLPLIINDITRGFLIFCSSEPGFFSEDHIAFLESVVGQVSFSIQRGELIAEREKHTVELEYIVEERTAEVVRIQRTTIFALSKLAEVRDPGTARHLERIRNYSILIATLLKTCSKRPDITDQFLKDLYDSSILHDIGKVGISDTILLKSSPLTPEEYEIMKTHTSIGCRALKEASENLGENSFLKMAMDIILYHHEKWDGSGYPEGLKGEEIPLAARIVRLSDVYDALTSRRPYKKAFTHQDALNIMMNDIKHFDPALFDLLIKYDQEFDNIRNKF
ncbi:MAG: response regulator [Spirochaetes bacterium]|nr:response regulator [Spirochaetota bacterium]